MTHSSQAGRRQVILGAAGLLAGSTFRRMARAAEAAADVVIVGAGLSGLRAALDLQDLGSSVQIIEGRDRVGGRVFSLKDLPGAPEAGGNSFLSGYGRCLDMAQRLKVPLYNYAARSRMTPQEIYLRGKRIPAAAWESSPLNIMPAAYKKLPPFAVAGTVFAKNNPLKSPDDWYDPAFAKYDIPVQAFFKQQGFTDAQIELAFNTNGYYGTSAHDVSLLLAMFNDVWSRGMDTDPPQSWACIGGNSLLPEAMARELKREIHFRKTVVGIRSEKDRAEVHCEDGSVYSAKHVICTVPLPVMRFIRFDPALPEHQTAAMKTVAYQPMTQVHFTVKEPFWDADGASPQMWTDTVIGSLAANRFSTKGDEITTLMTWSRGFNAIRMDQYPPDEAKKIATATIEKLRPAAKGKIVAAAIKSWLRDPFAGGDWAVWGPGQVRDLVPRIADPHGRIHFAGEHTAKSNRGMEGAMESGERAAQEVAGA